MILVTDYSNGNDMVIAKPGIKSLKELKGKKIGLELELGRAPAAAARRWRRSA